MEEYEAVWNKVFGMMSKSDADPSKNYADYLADTVGISCLHYSTNIREIITRYAISRQTRDSGCPMFSRIYSWRY